VRRAAGAPPSFAGPGSANTLSKCTRGFPGRDFAGRVGLCAPGTKRPEVSGSPWTAIWRAPSALLASRLMTGRRALPLLVGLWACLAFGQATPFQATSSIKLDGGTSFARAYMAHVGGATNKDYALVNAGGTIQVFDTSGVEHLNLEPPLGSTFSAFAILNGVINGAGTTTTIVAVADVTAPACATAMCLRIFSWDDTNGFLLLNTAPTTVLSATAMAIQSQANSPSSPLNAYYATSGSPVLYEQVVNVSSSDGSVTFGALNSRSLPTGSTVVGLSIDVPSTTAYLSDNASILYTFPANVTNLDGGIFAQPSVGGFSQIAGLFLFPPTSPTGLLAGGVGSGVYELAPFNPASIVVGSFIVIATDGGSTVPTAASYNAGQTLVAVTEDNTGSGAFLHIVPPVAAPDAGDGGADGGSDGGVVDGGGGADAGGIPTVPIVQPGPGAGPGPSNSCNCSSAGGAPLLLVFLLPLFAPRRRR
jgi:hypothetical protein